MASILEILRQAPMLRPPNAFRRTPHSSEQQYFSKNPQVTGMLSEDNNVVINPNSSLQEQEKKSVVRNELFRMLANKNASPKFSLTPAQVQSLTSTGYHNLPEDVRRKTIAARIASGDPSGGNPTQEQLQYIQQMLATNNLPMDDIQTSWKALFRQRLQNNLSDFLER